MAKSSKTLFVILISVLLCVSLALVACEKPVVYSVTFGSNTAQSVEKDGSITAPDYTVSDSLQTFLGWSTEEGKTSASDVLYAKDASISYEQLGKIAVEGQVKFYPVISTKKTIALTLKGATDKTATLVEGDATSVEAPAVTVGAKQEFLGWATSADATAPQIEADGIINYATIQPLSANGSATLYPVIKTYDLVIGVVTNKFAKTDPDSGDIIKSVDEYLAEIKAEFAVTHPDAEILFRLYEDKQAAVSGAKITEDGDCDVVLAGNNIDQMDEGDGKVVSIAKAKLVSKWNSDGSRRGVLITNSELALDFYAMVIGSENKNIEVTIGETKTVVNKVLGNLATIPEIPLPDSKIIIGWATTEDATEAQIVSETISYAEVEALATEGKVTLYPVLGNYDLIVGIVDIKFSATVDNVKVGVEYYRDLVKADFEKLYPDALVLYRIYTGLDGIAAYGAKINEDADVDVILAGNNINTDGGVTGVIAKAKLVEKYNADGSRRGALLSEDELALAMYSMATGVDSVSIEVTIKANAADAGIKASVHSILGGTVDLSAVVIPTGKKLAGFALTENATEALIVGKVIDYATVIEHATEGKITLYPVFEDDVKVDLVFDVLFKNITQEQLDKLIADFKAHLKASGDNNEYNIVVRNDFDGAGADFLARVKAAGDVDVVLGASNLKTQTGNDIMVKEGDGAYGKLLAVDGSSRHVGMIAGCAHQELALKFIEFCQTAPATAE